MVTDRIFLEILKHRLQAIADEMASVVLRTGYTVFVKETQDFGTAIVSPGGEIVAAPLKMGTTLGIGRPVHRTLSTFASLERGDIILANDPYTTNGMSTHLADIFLVKPIFVEGELVCHALAFIHSSDVGGKVPGSISPSSYEIFQEGLRIPPVKLFRAGQLNEEIRALLLANCRIPDQNWGDLRALLASLQVGQVRVGELVRRYGRGAVSEGIIGLLGYAEEQAREIIRRIPDGVYEAWDYLETGSAGDDLIRIRTRMKVDGDRILLDFSGTDHQVRAAFNLPTCGEASHYQLVNCFVRFFRTVHPDIPFNSGLVRPISCYTPTGSLLNPQFPAATGVRAATMIRVLDTTMATLGQALPDAMPAAGAGQAAIVLLSMPDTRTGKAKVGVVQPLIGGSGGRPMKDGIDGVDFHVGFLANIPTETIETEMPLLVERYGLRSNSGGAGRFRGGSGIELSLRIFVPESVMTARGMERHIFHPWGRLGGKPGAIGQVILTRRNGEELKFTKIDELLLQPGDVIHFRTPGGGGYGDPLERDPADVLDDVASGLITRDVVLAEYGVVIEGTAVDLEATRSERAKRVRRVMEFDFGSEREQYERLLPDRVQTLINQVLTRYPAAMRGFLRSQLIRRYLNDRKTEIRNCDLEECLDRILQSREITVVQ